MPDVRAHRSGFWPGAFQFIGGIGVVAGLFQQQSKVIARVGRVRDQGERAFVGAQGQLRIAGPASVAASPRL